jgi:hypothetical protein
LVSNLFFFYISRALFIATPAQAADQQAEAMMNRFSFPLIVAFGVLLWYMQLPAQQLIRKAGGYASKTICSAVFVSGR